MPCAREPVGSGAALSPEIQSLHRGSQALDHDEWEQWADYYDLSVGGHEPYIAFYRSLIEAQTRSMLDLGCGTGAVAAALAREIADRGGGFAEIRAVAVDGSRAMLRVARQRDPRLEWVLGDMRSPPVEGRFGLVISSYNALQSLETDGDLTRAFRAVAGLLDAGGRFAFDIYQPNDRYLERPYTDRLARSITDRRGRRLEVREDTRYDPTSRLLSVNWRLVDAGRGDAPPLAQTRYRMRQHFAADVERLLAGEGLVISERYGDLDRAPFDAESRKQVVVCRQA